MTSGMRTVIYPVKDLAQAKTLYGTLLGVEPDMDEAYYVGFSVGGQHVCLDPHGHSKGMTGPSAAGTSTTSRKVSSRSSTLARRRGKQSKMSVGASWWHP
jgi:extradiol dioxygenase family protein